MSDEVTVSFDKNGNAQVRLFGSRVSLNSAQVENLRSALLPAGVETPETPAEKPEPEKSAAKKSTKKG